MATIDDIRAGGERRLKRTLSALDSRHKAEVLAAIRRYGSVAAIPESVWDSIQKDIENETAAALLLLILASDDLAMSDLRRQGLDTSGIGVPLDGYSSSAARQAQEFARGVTRTTRDIFRAAEQGIAPGATVEDVARELRKAAEEAFGATRRETQYGTETVRASTVGQMGAADRGEGGTKDGQRVRVELIWVNHPEQSRSGPCPICEPLNGQPESVWRREFPDGPPTPHPGCVCTLDPRVIVTE